MNLVDGRPSLTTIVQQLLLREPDVATPPALSIESSISESKFVVQNASTGSWERIS